ncbi:hypothetical protein POSPLADRAFT_1056486 [Postia placenta MAD-698-R-SB12]|uniref:Uncharacterized protein n=1 Tax=Postia placenta MAD-698-R-SB12 TaxID=670580 RepID=A0A1X6N3S7_9APHY|nr:hypothetical protein POSPLADRAFT_1056486 [Postia placenta MAD-698-R-SB12]OSX63126.1 hypothetical protein POSPLADRAFT_1056486 [Postia placenta MAD-698-R-SB12]
MVFYTASARALRHIPLSHSLFARNSASSTTLCAILPGSTPLRIPPLQTGCQRRGKHSSRSPAGTRIRGPKRGLVHVAPGSVLASLACEPLAQDEEQLLDKVGRAHAQRDTPQEVQVHGEVDACAVLRKALKSHEGRDAEVGG